MTSVTDQLIIGAVAKQKYRKVHTNAQDHLLDFCEETYSGYHRAKHLVLVAEALEEIVRWEFVNAFPVKWTGPSLQAASSGVSIETLELAHAGLITF